MDRRARARHRPVRARPLLLRTAAHAGGRRVARRARVPRQRDPRRLLQVRADAQRLAVGRRGADEPRGRRASRASGRDVRVRPRARTDSRLGALLGREGPRDVECGDHADRKADVGDHEQMRRLVLRQEARRVLEREVDRHRDDR